HPPSERISRKRARSRGRGLGRTGMIGLSRRELLQGAGALAAGTTLRRLQPRLGITLPDGSIPQVPDWVRSIRLLIAEGYAPPFYPALDYDPRRAVAIARALGCNAL